MFPPAPQQMLQQQYMQGVSVAQQGAMLEMNGNVVGAVQCYDQAAMVLSQCVALALQSQVPVNAQDWFNVSWCHFNAARTKTMLGWGAAAPAHLMQAHNALNNAINLNPSFGPYHAAMGVLLASEGQPLMAMQAFMRAVQLNPADGFSQYMLAILNQARGNVTAGHQYFTAAQQYVPNLPPPQQTVQAHGGGEKGFDWNGLVSTAGQFFKAVNTVSGLFSNLQSQSQPAPGGGWGGGDFGGGGGFNW